MSTRTDEILRRRTFAIISHPDAGKTTLTEKLLLFGGAIQLAGEVKARGERRRAISSVKVGMSWLLRLRDTSRPLQATPLRRPVGIYGRAPFFQWSRRR